jgi:serine/threonine-protein kinase
MHKRSKLQKILGLISFFSFSAAILVAVTLLSIYLPPSAPETQDISIPDMTGSAYLEDDPRLPREIFTVTVEYRADDTIREGVVLSQTPAPHAIRRVLPQKRRCELHLVVSAGQQTLTLPDLSGLGTDTAQRMLREMGLLPVKISRTTNAYAPGQIIETRPQAGTALHKGDTVTLVEATVRTQRTLTVPDVLGMSRAEAANALGRAGLTVGSVVYRSADQAAETVIAQFPLGNTVIVAGSRTVTLTLSDGTLQAPPQQMPEPDAPAPDDAAPSPDLPE